MAAAKIAFRRMQDGTFATDQTQRLAQQVSQKVNALSGRSVLVSAGYVSTTSNYVSASATMADVSGLSLSLTCLAGDTLIIDSSLYAFISSGAGTGVAQLAIVDNGATQTIGAQGITSSTLAVTTTMTGLWVVQRPGTIVVKVQALATGGSTLTVFGNAATTSARSSIRVQQLRAF